jgi:hypothetical protein
MWSLASDHAHCFLKLFMTLYEWRVTDVSLYAGVLNSCISQRTLLKLSIFMCYDCV